MLSSRRDLTARICQHITLSSARRSHGLTRPLSHSSRAGTAVDTMTTAPHRMAPAARSPDGVLGHMHRSARSNALIQDHRMGKSVGVTHQKVYAKADNKCRKRPHHAVSPPPCIVKI